MTSESSGEVEVVNGDKKLSKKEQNKLAKQQKKAERKAEVHFCKSLLLPLNIVQLGKLELFLIVCIVALQALHCGGYFFCLLVVECRLLLNVHFSMQLLILLKMRKK